MKHWSKDTTRFFDRFLTGTLFTNVRFFWELLTISTPSWVVENSSNENSDAIFMNGSRESWSLFMLGGVLILDMWDCMASAWQARAHVPCRKASRASQRWVWVWVHAYMTHLVWFRALSHFQYKGIFSLRTDQDVTLSSGEMLMLPSMDKNELWFEA